MIDTAALLSPSWLIPPGAEQQQGEHLTALLPTGVLWDAVRTRLAPGVVLLDQFLTRPEDRDRLGPVLQDLRGGWLYWLIAPGSSDTWPRGTELLSTGGWLRVPASERNTGREASWAYLPSIRRLTGAAWLATALWEQHRAGERACDYCDEPTEGRVVAARPKDCSSPRAALDHDACYGLLIGAMEITQAAMAGLAGSAE
ncbi:hypothetical protein ACEZCY_19155 [Streptacidiphilus sp. N1-12]|uniref:Uncharacterized protein n=2 Tax=Streptacidiphilus alkalitolerans TaxID=3342712 RepID=A0ABV6VBF0_9ACTN